MVNVFYLEPDSKRYLLMKKNQESQNKKYDSNKNRNPTISHLNHQTIIDNQGFKSS